MTKIGQICVPYKFAESSGIPPKIKCQILAHKGSQTTSATPGDYLAPGNRKPIGQWNLLASITMDQDFAVKVTHCRLFFFFFYLDCSVERCGGRHNNEQSCQRQRKNPLQKLKTCKAEEQDNESTYSFQNYDSRRFLMFLYQD